MSTTFTITLPEPLWTIKLIEPVDKMRDVERHFCITVECALEDINRDPNVMSIIRMVQRANKIFNKRMKDQRNRFDVELKVKDRKTITVTLNTTFNSKELFQIINTK